MEASYPVPDERSLAAGSAVLEFVSSLKPDDLLICLISGGGSALASAPYPGVSLGDLQRLTSSLLACGASITEINLIRRRLDRLKGGGLVNSTKANIIALIFSDVIGDHLEVIASGLTVASAHSHPDPISIIEKYKIATELKISSLLKTMPTYHEKTRHRIQNVIIGNNQIALNAAKAQAENDGFHVELLGSEILRGSSNYWCAACREACQVCRCGGVSFLHHRRWRNDSYA